MQLGPTLKVPLCNFVWCQERESPSAMDIIMRKMEKFLVALKKTAAAKKGGTCPGASWARGSYADEVEGKLLDLWESLPLVALAGDAQRQQQHQADLAEALQEVDHNARRANALVGVARGKQWYYYSYGT